MRIRCWVRAISSRCTELTSSSCSRARSRSVARDRQQLLLAAAAGLLDRGARLGGPVRSTPRAGPGRRSTPRPTASAARPSRTQPLAALDRRGPGPRARPAAAREQRVGAAVEGAGPLLGWCAARAGRPSRPAGPRGPPRRAARARWCRAPRRAPSSAAAEAVLELGETGEVLVARLLGGRDRLVEPLGLGAGRRGPGSRSWPSSSATAARVASDSCSLASATSTRRWASRRSRSRRAMSKPSRSEARDRLGELARRPRRRRPGSRSGWAGAAEPPAAKWAPRRSPSRVTAVTSGSVGDQRRGRRRGRRRPRS